MAGYEHAFQAIDETIADCCLRELPWEFSSNLWREDPATNARKRIEEVYRVGRPLILKILKTDKSPLKNRKKVSITRSMMTMAQDKMQHQSPYEALTAYNKAVIFAPHLEDHLSRACADRAACLLQIGDPESALVDIEQALAIDEYPFEKLFELEERRGHAFAGMKQFEKAQASFTQAILRLEDAAGFLQRKMVERKMSELQNALAAVKYKKDEVVKDGSSCKFMNMKKLPELNGRNQSYPALSSKVDVHSNPRKGREVFTNSKVAAGDLLGLEKPLVSFLEKDYMKSNCWHCLVTLKAPYACPLCSAVKFCSKSCLDEALQSYHPYECLLTDLLVSNRISSWVLAYRAISTRPLRHHLNCRDSRNSAVFASDDLANLLKLPFPRTEQSEVVNKKRTVMTVFYLILLQMTGYFDSKDTLKVNPSLSSIQQMVGKENESSLSEEELYIGQLLEKTIGITPYCTTEVCHFEMTALGDWTTGKVTPVIGKTINPTLSLVTHSCYPTAARVCHENKTLLVAQKNIGPGERITINYSAPFYAAARAERKEYLNIGFSLNCDCAPCTHDWPLFDLLPPGPPGLQLPELEPTSTVVEVPAFRPIPGLGPISDNNSHLTKTEQSVVDTLNKVKSRIEQLQAGQGTNSPPSKVMIQSQVRLFRCLLAMYSSKLYTVKTGCGSLPIPV